MRICALALAGVCLALLPPPSSAATDCCAKKPAVRLAANKPAGKPAPKRKMTAKECAIACKKALRAKGMAGHCPENLCTTGRCPMWNRQNKGHG